MKNEKFNIKIAIPIVFIDFLMEPSKEDVFTAIDKVAEIKSWHLRFWDLSNGFNLKTDDLIDIANYGKKNYPVNLAPRYLLLQI